MNKEVGQIIASMRLSGFELTADEIDELEQCSEGKLETGIIIHELISKYMIAEDI